MPSRYKLTCSAYCLNFTFLFLLFFKFTYRMKELEDIVKAFDVAEQAGKQTALATVVQVEGSSYRRAGARMLITEDGQLTSTNGSG